MKHTWFRAVCAAFLLCTGLNNAPASDTGLDAKMVERGRYLARIAGCNDCHTPGYLMSGGTTPESLWLTGDKFG